MKKIYLLIIASFMSVAFNAQVSTPNGNFELWTSGTYENPQFFPSSSNPQTFFQCTSPFNCLKVADPYHGSFAVQLTTNVGSDTCMGFVVNSPNPNGGNPCQWPGGTAYTQTPTGIRGYYKNNSVGIDSGGILVAFKNGATCLGLYMYKFGGVHNVYTPFAFTFVPPLAGTPDTMTFAAISSDIFNNVQKNGSMLQLDSISFTGVTQPANFNGDFELWQSQTVEKPNSWYLQGAGGNGPTGVLKTTDKKAGTYAAEMITQLGKGNGGAPVAQSSGISTGYYPNNCSGMCVQQGGWPFTNQIDTLAFYYKYAPSGSDTAQASLNFKKNGSNVFGTGNFLLAAGTYQYVKIPFNIGSPIDSVIVSFQSSSWRDSALSFIGSDLKVDEVHFLSQPLTTGIKTFDAAIGIKIFPNPSNDGNFVVSNVNTYDLVRVYNVYGQEVYAEIKKENDYAKITIENSGAYFVQINAHGKITTQKIIVNKE